MSGFLFLYSDKLIFTFVGGVCSGVSPSGLSWKIVRRNKDSYHSYAYDKCVRPLEDTYTVYFDDDIFCSVCDLDHAMKLIGDLYIRG